MSCKLATVDGAMLGLVAVHALDFCDVDDAGREPKIGPVRRFLRNMGQRQRLGLGNAPYFTARIGEREGTA